jgi:PKD repeat protein
MSRDFSSRGLSLFLIALIATVGSVAAVLTYSGYRIPGALTGPSLTFTAAGDFGAGTGGDTPLVLAGMDDNANFALAAGDLSYGAAGAEPLDSITPSPWCNYVKGLIPTAGSGFPFQLAMGNHEQDDAESRIANIKVCLPNLMSNAVSATFSCGSIPFNDGLNGCYAIAYYFDYPASSPIARFIVTYHTTTSTMQGLVQSYTVGSLQYAWVSGVIDSAKALGLWTVVVTHKPYFSTGGSGESGGDMHKLFAAKKVDLVISGHDHNYQRSKQLTCGTFATYTATCVSDDGLDGQYTKGTGTVFVIAGTGGNGLVTVGQNLVQRNYFVTWNDQSYGYLRVQMDSGGLQAGFVRVGGISGTYSDSFVIGTFAQPPSMTAGISYLPVNPTVGTNILFSGSVSGGVAPYFWSWNFGDGTTASSQYIQNPQKSYAVAGSYQVTLNVSDSSASQLIATASVSVTVQPAAPLVVSFTYSPSQLQVGTTVTFTGTVSGGTSPYILSWTFGDGTGTAGATVNHAYVNQGTYTVQLTASDFSSQSASTSQQITVTGSTSALTATFTWSPAIPVIGQSVTFTAIIAGGTAPYVVGWNFGDGTTSAANPAFHTYGLARSYNVTLLVTDAGSRQTTVIGTITVQTGQNPPSVFCLFTVCGSNLAVLALGGGLVFFGSVLVGSGVRGKRK